MDTIIYTLSEKDRLANHIPEDVWVLSRSHNVFIKDTKTGEFISILDLCSDDNSA